MTTFQDRAYNAYQSFRAKAEAESRRQRMEKNNAHADRLTRIFQRDFGEAPDSVDPEASTATRDGLTLYYHQGASCWRLFHEDGEVTYYSPPIGDMASLGQQLAEWNWEDQVVTVEEVEETREERVTRLIEALLREFPA